MRSAMGLFNKERDLRPKVREMQTQLRREQRKLDRDIAGIQQKSKQCEAEVKKYAKTGNIEAAKMLAKEIASSRKAVSRLYMAKAQINSVVMELENQIAVAKMASALNQSTQVMQVMSNLVKLPELQTTVRNMSKEMMKLGIINEMVDDSIESALGSNEEETEELAQSEINKILYDVTNGLMGKAPDAITDTLPAGTAARFPTTPADEEVSREFDDLAARVDTIR